MFVCVCACAICVCTRHQAPAQWCCRSKFELILNYYGDLQADCSADWPVPDPRQSTIDP